MKPSALPQSVPASSLGDAAIPDALKTSLAEIVSGFSFALDLAEDARPGHAVRTCLLGMRIAIEAGLPGSQLGELYYALLLKDLGSSSNARLLCEIVGGDDRAIKRRVKLEDWRYPSLSGLKLLWENAGAGLPPLKKSQRVLGLALGRSAFRRELVRMRCQSSLRIGRKIGLPAATIDAIAGFDEHWDGCGYPDRLRREEIPVAARVIHLAQCLDLFASEAGVCAAMRRVRERSGSWFDPELVDAAGSLAKRQRLWEFYGSGLERKAALDLEPGRRLCASERQIDDIAEGFAEIVDAKSSFAHSHSMGVTETAMQVTRRMGIAGERSRLIYRAALLHDLGTLRIPNTILDKPGKLDVIEWQTVREHPGLGAEILGRIRPFKELARIVGEHHERLDGSGYPEGLKDDQIALESKIIAVADVYSALVEDRPHRKGMSRAEAEVVMARQVPEKLDADCCAALFSSAASGLPFERRDSALLRSGVCA
jgi:putative nucleotidyltransferase with HDIG domain